MLYSDEQLLAESRGEQPVQVAMVTTVSTMESTGPDRRHRARARRRDKDKAERHKGLINLGESGGVDVKACIPNV